MRVLRDPQIIRGFIYEEPVEELPSLTHCGEALCARGHTRPLHTHDGFEFLYLLRGSCNWEVAGNSYRQGMGEMFIAYPHEAHCTGAEPNPENQHLWMGLRLDKMHGGGLQLAREIRKRNIRMLARCQEAEPLLHAIISQVVELRPQRTEVLRALLDAFVALMAQQISVIGHAQGTPRGQSILPYSFAVQRAIAYMRQNLDRRLQLSDLASVATIRNVSHFCTQFHWEVGITPSLYHMQLRLEAARDFLHQPSADITNTALQFGFSSSQHFSTLFRRAFGVTPRQWKAREVDPIATRLRA